MAFDSLIRLKQMNQSDLSGFLLQAMFPLMTGNGFSVGGSIVPTTSGSFNLGSSSLPFDGVYADGLFVPSGSGLWFGSNFFTAYTSGTNAVLSVNGYTITSNGLGVSIIGPTGPSGSQGVIGPSGATGISVTGVATGANSSVYFLLSNGTSGNPVPLPSGVAGPSGNSTTGFYQSGNYLIPQYSNHTSGVPIYIPTGLQGAQGEVGGITINFGQITGFKTGDILPYVEIPNVSPYYINNPPLNFVNGMAYTLNYSGLGISGINIPGTGEITGDIFVDSAGITGYLKFQVFSPAATTGRYCYGESLESYSDMLAYVVSSSVLDNQAESNYRQTLSFNTDLAAGGQYYYGFQKYYFNDGQPIDEDGPNWGFYILGTLNVNWFGPTGPSGQQGVQGIPGPAGLTGPAGTNGASGVSVTGVSTVGNTMAFLLSNGTSTPYVNLPLGGPTGPAGATGPTGPSGAQGPMGMTGPQGVSDTYAAEFYYYNMTLSGYTGFFKEVGGNPPWTICTGTGMVCQPGDKIWFTTPSLVGKAYTPWQQILVANDSYSAAQYFYATVSYFNNNNGEVQMVVNSTPSPAGLVGGNIQLYNYNLIDMNLGGLGSTGPTGPQGIQGVPGNTGHQVFMLSPLTGIHYNVSGVIDPNLYDWWNVYFTGDTNIIDFKYANFSTGQTVMLKVTNSGTETNDGENPLIYWSPSISGILFPYNTIAPAPNPGLSALYTFIRGIDSGTTPSIYCTYSVDYPR